MAISRVRMILGRLKDLKARKQPWLTHYQLIGEVILTRKQNFTEVNQPGAFLTRELFDNTAIKANNVMASALIGALWPNGAKTFSLLPADGIPDSTEVKDYFVKISTIMTNIMDDSRSGLTVALNEYMNDQGSFGTSGIGIFENPKGPLPIRYVAWDVKHMNIDENENRIIDTIYNVREMTVRQVVLEYGLENVSKKIRDSFNNSKQLDKVKVLHAIEPRMEADPFKFGNKDMPVASIHIELGSEKILRESGFEEMPVPVSRFAKALGEVYGRSPGMAALPDILELNVVWEAVTLAVEKMLDPPLGVLSDGDLGGAVIDTSAGAINVFNVSGRAGQQQPIFPLFTVGELKAVDPLLEKLTKSITDHFFIDRLLDLNNETRMTLGEAQIRNELRAMSLGSIFSRQEAEMFTPLINRTFNLLLKQGELGVMPNSKEAAALVKAGEEFGLIPEAIARRMLAGKDVFKIKYVSPAKRAMEAESVQGTLASWNFTATVAAMVPDVIDNFKMDDMIKRVARVTGVDEADIQDLESVKKIREARSQQAAALQQREIAKENSEIARNMAQAKQAVTPQGAGA